MYDLSLQNGKVYIDGEFIETNIYIKDEVISRLTKNNLESKKIIDCKNRLIMPGFIDPHVHFELDLGEFKSIDDFHQGSKIAALGGVTTFIDFLDPIKDNNELLSSFENRKKLAKKSLIDYSFHTTLGNFVGDVEKLKEDTKKLGIPSIKVFTTYSDSDRKISLKKLYDLISEDILVLIHAEKDDLITNPKNIDEYEESRPCYGEYIQMLEISAISELKKGRVYFVHTTCDKTLEKISEKFKDSLMDLIYFESCPQYFYLDKSVYRSDNNKLFLLAPPFRDKKIVLGLRKNIDKIYSIGTDHCSFTKLDKEKYSEVSKIPKGIGSIEFSFSLMYNLFGKNIIDRFTKNPAKLFGLYPKRGIINEASYANLVVFNPNKEFIIDSGSSYSDYTPYEGIKLNGKVEKTILRGNIIVNDYKYCGKINGRFIRRNL